MDVILFWLGAVMFSAAVWASFIYVVYNYIIINIQRCIGG